MDKDYIPIMDDNDAGIVEDTEEGEGVKQKDGHDYNSGGNGND